jgi:hypothetical protein
MSKENISNKEKGNGVLADVSQSLPDGWKDFEAGFLAAREFYNNELAGKRKWILLPDKKIANAFFKYKKSNVG